MWLRGDDDDANEMLSGLVSMASRSPPLPPSPGPSSSVVALEKCLRGADEEAAGEERRARASDDARV